MGHSERPLRSLAASTNSFQYTGRENDGTGLYYYRARYFNPATGRFISEDPIGFAGGVDLYGYVWNSPTNFWDPFGHWPQRPPNIPPGMDPGSPGQRPPGQPQPTPVTPPTEAPWGPDGQPPYDPHIPPVTDPANPEPHWEPPYPPWDPFFPDFLLPVVNPCIFFPGASYCPHPSSAA